jgi:ATP-binding cassette subfamily A (ABC1) protein 3
MLVKLKMEFKKNARASTLSGGQKRKLSLAIALIGGSEVIFGDNCDFSCEKNRKNSKN